MGFGSGKFAGQSYTVTHGHWTSFWYLWQYGQVPSPAGKLNQHLHKACQQKEAWSALKCLGRCLCWLWTSESTADQHQQMTWRPKPSLTVETLPSVWIGFTWQYSQACGHPCCLCTFSYPIFFLSANFAFNMLWYSTPWTSPPPPSSSNDPLWLIVFVEVLMIIFWTIAKSAVFSIIVLSKNKRYPEFILYGWSFIETQI